MLSNANVKLFWSTLEKILLWKWHIYLNDMSSWYIKSFISSKQLQAPGRPSNLKSKLDLFLFKGFHKQANAPMAYYDNQIFSWYSEINECGLILSWILLTKWLCCVLWVLICIVHWVCIFIMWHTHVGWICTM